MTSRINLETPRVAGYPVVKRAALGQTFCGAVLKAESRDRQKKGADGVLRPIPKPNGKHAQELVVTCMTLPGTTAPVGLDDYEGIPKPGDIVRLILTGKAFGDWIDAKKQLPGGAVAVGDLVTQTTTVAIVYKDEGETAGPEITDQAMVDQARAKGRTVGIYGPLTLTINPSQESITQAVAAYKALQEAAPVERFPAEQYDEAQNIPGPAGPPPPPPPPGITPEAWATFSPETRAALSSITTQADNDTPPF